MVDSPNDALQTHKVSGGTPPRGGFSGQKSPENLGKLSPGRRGGGYWGGRPLWDISTYLCQHRRGITQNFMVDSPSETLQTHKFPGRNPPRGTVSGQKSLQNPESGRDTLLNRLSCKILKVHALRTPKCFRARPWDER